MELELRGKTAYVTGAARGIGTAVADALAAAGARIAASDIEAELLERQRGSWTVDGVEPVIIGADLSTHQGCVSAARAAAEGLGEAPDVLVNNVGVGIVRQFEEIPDDGWLQTMELNFMSYVRTSRELVPRMARRGMGAVVNIASDLAKQPEPVPADYAASKASILSLTKSLAIEYSPQIRVNAVCPGPIWTHFWTKPGGFAETLGTMYDLPQDEAVEKFIGERNLPLARIGEPVDVAAVVLFLASPLAKYVTGSSYNVDGGSVRSIV